jgi:glutathione S-transferase
MLRLYTFQVSHFAEKARWALDYKRVPYEERRLLPGPHLAVTRRLSRRTSVPLLLAGGRVVQGPSEIIDFAEQRWLDRPLNPQDSGLLEQALELEGWLDRELGERLRRVFYFYALRQLEIVLQLFTQGRPWWGRLFIKRACPSSAIGSARCTPSTRKMSPRIASSWRPPSSVWMRYSRVEGTWSAIISLERI